MDLVLLDCKVGLGDVRRQLRALLTLLDLERLALGLDGAQLFFEAEQVGLELVEDFLAHPPDELAFLGRHSCLDLQLAEFFLHQLVLLRSDLSDVQIGMSPLVVGHQVGVAGEELGALTAPRELEWCAFWLSQDLLVGLHCLLLDPDVGFGVHQQLLLGAHFVFEFGTACPLLLQFAEAGRELKLRLRLQEEEVLEGKLSSLEQLDVVPVPDPSNVGRLEPRIRDVLEELLQVVDIRVLNDSVEVGSRHHVPVEALCFGLERKSHLKILFQTLI